MTKLLDLLSQLDTFTQAITAIFAIITTCLSGYGGLFLWRQNFAKDKSALIKETKVNSTDGDTALINQLDLLLVKITSLSETVMKVQAELAKEKNINLTWESAVYRLKLKCDEFCKNGVLCKSLIDQITTELKLDKNDS